MLEELADAVRLGKATLALSPKVAGLQRVHPTIRYLGRTLPVHVMHLVRRGCIERRVGGSHLESRAGSVFWLAPGIRHDFIFHPRTEHLVLQFEIRGPARVKLENPGWLAHPRADRLFWYFERLAKAVQERGEDSMRLVQACFELLLLEFAGLLRDGNHGGLTPAQRHRIDDQILLPRGKNLGSGELASHLGLSRDYFARVFHKTYGVSPRKHILSTRMRAAAFDLAEAGARIEGVAERFGYDRFTFSKSFKKVLGISPAAYQRQARLTSHGRSGS
jgi:AraC-like DNA-binding protein